MKNKTLKFLLWLVAVHAVAALSIFGVFNRDLFSKIHGVVDDGGKALQSDEFNITVSQIARNMDPTVYDWFYGKRELNFVYEPLVKFDDFFNIQPALAVSWGMLSDTEWKLNLREDVKFHDGSTFGPEDVIASFYRAKEHSDSVLKDFTDTIDSVVKVGANSVKITTKEPSPNFLPGLATLFIIPEEFQDKNKFTEQVGTGPFKLVKRDESQVAFEKFAEYWDTHTNFPQKLNIFNKENKYERLGDLMSGKTNILADVPSSFYEQIEKRSNAKIVQSPGNKSVFILFNLKNPFLQNVNNRKAISYAINRQEMLNITGRTSRVSNQFAGSGIFGFNPDISESSFDIDTAKSMVESEGITILTMNVAEENIQLAEFLRMQLDGLGIKVKLNVVDSSDLTKNLKEGKGDMFLAGWDYTKGNTNRFLDQLISDGGLLEGVNFDNEDFKSKVAEALGEMKDEKRLDILQDAMEIIVNKDPIGVPLFTVDNLFAINPSKFKVATRPDGIIHF